MNRLLGTAAVIALCPAIASALGLDRSGQPVDLLFEDGNRIELNFGRVFPDITGNDQPAFGGGDSGEVADIFNQAGFGVKYQFDDRISLALLFDQPYGSDIAYPEAADGGLLTLGGTRANVDSRAITALARYEFNDAFSVHGGLRYQEISADVTLQGAAYGPLSGYRAEFDSDGDLGFVIGAAYERPDIALRLALTYISETTHDLRTTETINGVGVNIITGGAFPANSTTEIVAPEAINLDFQTGIAPDTLLFANIRYARYEDTLVSPTFFDASVPGEGSSLTDIDNNTAWTIGLGRRFNDKLSGSISVGYENSQDNLVSPLAPTNGNQALALGLSYNVTEQLNVSGGVRYVRLGGAEPETGGTPVADFQDNHAVGVGLQFGYSF